MGIWHISLHQIGAEVIFWCFRPEELPLDWMKLIQNEMAAVGGKHPHNRQEAVEIPMVVENAQFKNKASNWWGRSKAAASITSETA